MDKREKIQIYPLIQPLNYGNEEEYYSFCNFCLKYWLRRAPKTLTRCPNCGEPFYEDI